MMRAAVRKPFDAAVTFDLLRNQYHRTPPILLRISKKGGTIAATTIAARNAISREIEEALRRFG